MEPPTPTQNEPREIRGWMLYDWANSAFSTTVVTVFLNPYLTGIARGSADASGFLHLLGIPIRYDSYFEYCAALSVGLQVFFLPLLGAIADHSHLRKRMMQFCTLLGAGATALLFLVGPGGHWLGGALFVLANLAFGGSMVFYNSYLPDIASEDRRDSVSSGGWGLGYLGGGVLLLLNLLLLNFSGRLGLDRGLAVRLCILSAAVWWFGFAQITFATLRSRGPKRPLKPGESYVGVGMRQLGRTFREIRRYPQTLRYLLAYLLFNDGVQTVILVSSKFGVQELGMSQGRLVLMILMVQGVAFIGAHAFGALAGRIGAKGAVVASLILWCGVVIYAWSSLRTENQFWGMAVVVALVLGGSQALSRSLFSRMIPPGREAEFFSFYEVSERGTSWIGPFLFGLVNQIFGSLRYGILSLIVLFVTGLLVLLRVDVRRAMEEAGRARDLPGTGS